MIRVELNRLKPLEFNILFCSVGWAAPEVEQVEIALDNSICTFSLYEDNELIGMARLLGDKAMSFYLLNHVPYQNNEFDVVLCNLVLMDIDPIDNAISEFYRIIKNGGIFFFSIVHPAFCQAVWERNEQGVILSKKVSGYITPQAKQQDFWGNTMHFHRPISYYFNKVSDAGFSLKNMFEPKVYEGSKIPDIPLYLFAEFIKR